MTARTPRPAGKTVLDRRAFSYAYWPNGWRKAPTDTYLLKRHAHAFDTVVAYGNGNGLIAERHVKGDLSEGDLLVPPTELTGPAPWWVAFPGRTARGLGDQAANYISVIIRDYQASFGGRVSSAPFLTVRIMAREGNEAKLETRLTPPPSVRTAALRRRMP